MASAGLEIMAMGLCIFGWLGTILSCALPMWKVSAFIGNNIVVAQIIWEGLWMNCVVQSTGQMQCKIYDSMLALPQDIQAARALMVISVVLAVLALLDFSLLFLSAGLPTPSSVTFIIQLWLNLSKGNWGLLYILVGQLLPYYSLEDHSCAAPAHHGTTVTQAVLHILFQPDLLLHQAVRLTSGIMYEQL
uniref:Claudin n=1 Tax=Laticauda laticaudata TaxID=8630 RepID=A0A8C5STS4_LATLA